jgi:hypothetical protein
LVTTTTEADDKMSANPSLGAVLFTDLVATPQQVGAIEQRILRGMEVVNTNTAVAFVQCYDSATSPTLGSPKLSFGVPGASSSTLGNVWWFSDIDLQFNNGLWLAATTTATGTSAPSVGLITSVIYD